MENKTKDSLQQNQFGFRNNRGTREAVLSLRIIMKKTMRINKEILIGTVDITKAPQHQLECSKSSEIDVYKRQIVY